jgi:hypothetical protein
VADLGEFAELVLLLSIAICPAVLFATGCHELSKWYWSKELVRARARHPSRERL